MVQKPDLGDESFAVPIADDCIRDAAADHPVTYDQVYEALELIQQDLAGKLNQLYEEAWTDGGAQNHLADASDGVWFALIPFDVWEPINDEVDEGVFMAAMDAHERMAADRFRFEIDRPTSYAAKLEQDYRAFFIAFPEAWRSALYHARVRMKHLLHHGLTPAEALDYWALEAGPGRLQTNRAGDGWYAARGVDREAVNKTVRQAREKLGDEDCRPYYPEQVIRTAKVE